VQSDSALLGIQLGYSLIPGVSLLISAIVFWKWYKLDGKEWIARKVELGRLHLQKEKEYIEKLRKEGKISKVYQKLYGESLEEI